jgi:hypothetical protein
MTSGWSFLSRMQQHTPLEQREACLSIRTAFDPFHLLMNPSTMPLLQVMLHPLTTASASSANELDKSDQLGNPTGPDSGFPLLQAPLPIVLSQ